MQQCTMVGRRGLPERHSRALHWQPSRPAASSAGLCGIRQLPSCLQPRSPVASAASSKILLRGCNRLAVGHVCVTSQTAAAQACAVCSGESTGSQHVPGAVTWAPCCGALTCTVVIRMPWGRRAESVAKAGLAGSSVCCLAWTPQPPVAHHDLAPQTTGPQVSQGTQEWSLA